MEGAVSRVRLHINAPKLRERPRAGSRINYVYVCSRKKVCATISDVGNLSDKGASKILLNGKVPLLRIQITPIALQRSRRRSQALC